MRFKPPRRIVREINKRMAWEADRLVSYHRPAPWVFPFLAEQDQQYHPLN